MVVAWADGLQNVVEFTVKSFALKGFVAGSVGTGGAERIHGWRDKGESRGRERFPKGENCLKYGKISKLLLISFFDLSI
jgi:hypothetical protein